MPKLKNTAHIRRTRKEFLRKSKENESTAKESVKMKKRRQLLRGSGAIDTKAVRNAVSGRYSL